MNKRKRSAAYPHENRAEFHAALEYTQGSTGFRSELIEKDYFCSLVLSVIFAASGHDLVFKGGTCLNKVYMGFFRLSEDLDFSVPIPASATRAERSRRAKPLKPLLDDVAAAISGLSIGSPLVGANNSTQYVAKLLYRSALSDDPGRIKFEVGLREDLLEPAVTAIATTLVENPFSRKPLVDGTAVRCLSLQEALAEKVRAMFTRKDIAIRDFFDYWHARRGANASFDEAALLSMAVKKIAISTTPYVALEKERIAILKAQLLTDLRPVLTEATFQDFPLAEAIAEAHRIERTLRSQIPV